MGSCGGTGSTSTPASPSATSSPTPPQLGCTRTSVGLTPLTDVGGTYEGQRGGLYPGGTNAAPAAHIQAGVARARAIVPMEADGRPSTSGRYAFVSIGMSNTTQEFSAFKPMADADPSRDPRLVIVDGAQGGMTALDWSSTGCSCWSVLEQRLRQAGVAPAQVAVAWIKLADRQPTGAWPSHAQQLRDNITAVIRLLPSRFPNLRLAYLSSRIYAGYASSTLNPEPYAYQSGYSVRWVIEQQLAGSLRFDGPAPDAPWLAWGPYLWADGLTPGADGLTWECSDFASDGTHPGATGRQKVAQRLLEFVRRDATAREWYLLAQP